MVKEEPMVRHYVFWGEVKDSFSDWMQWIEDAKELFALLGESPSHYAISTLELDDIKMRPIGGLSRKLSNIKKKSHTMDFAEFDLLPNNYRDTLDFYISVSRMKRTEVIRKTGKLDFVGCAIDLNYVQKHGGLTPVIEQRILKLLEWNILPQVGEVYEMRNKLLGIDYYMDYPQKRPWKENETPNILTRFDGKEWREV